MTNIWHLTPSLKIQWLGMLILRQKYTPTWKLDNLYYHYVYLSLSTFQRERWQCNSWISERISKPSDFSCQNYWTELFVELNSFKIFVVISLKINFCNINICAPYPASTPHAQKSRFFTLTAFWLLSFFLFISTNENSTSFLF